MPKLLQRLFFFCNFANVLCVYLSSLSVLLAVKLKSNYKY